MAGKLVIVRHYEPPSDEEAVELRRRVIDCLFDPATLNELTRKEPLDTIKLEHILAQIGKGLE
jgi:hypothetical protein